MLTVRAAKQIRNQGRVKLTRRSPRRPPLWWYQLIHARLTAPDGSAKALAAQFGRSAHQVEKVLASPLRREIEALVMARVREETADAIVPAVIQFQQSSPEMAGILLQAARDAAKPRERAEIAEKALVFAGEKPAEKKVILTLEAKLGQLSEAELHALATRGEIPAALRHELTAPLAIDVTPADGDDAPAA